MLFLCVCRPLYIHKHKKIFNFSSSFALRMRSVPFHRDNTLVLLLMTETPSLMQYPSFFLSLSPFLPATKFWINKAALVLPPLYALYSVSSSCLLAKWCMDIYCSVYCIENRCFALYKCKFYETGYPKIKFWHLLIFETQNKEYRPCFQKLGWFIVQVFLPGRI
jgi:hypothetical protein